MNIKIIIVICIFSVSTLCQDLLKYYPRFNNWQTLQCGEKFSLYIRKHGENKIYPVVQSTQGPYIAVTSTSGASSAKGEFGCWTPGKLTLNKIDDVGATFYINSVKPRQQQLNFILEKYAISVNGNEMRWIKRARLSNANKAVKLRMEIKGKGDSWISRETYNNAIQMINAESFAAELYLVSTEDQMNTINI